MSNEEPQTEGDHTQRAWIGWLQIGVIIGVIVLAMALTAALSSSGDRTGGIAPERPPTPVSVIEPDRVVYETQIELTGSVVPPADVTLTPQVSGRVVALSELVRPGSSFAAGDILFEIDPRDYEVAVTRARASLAEAQSALDQLEAEAEINRAEWAREYPGRPITALAAREPQLMSARSRVEAARADLMQARINLERTQISFPFEGRVVESRIEAGQLVNAGVSYGQVYDASSLEIIAPISPSDLARLGDAEGLTARLIIDESQQELSAEITRVGARLDPRTRFIDLYITPRNPGILRPGQFADVIIDGPSTADVFLLPARAMAGLNQVNIVRNGQIETLDVDVLDRPRGGVVVQPFNFAQGVIITPVPETAIGRTANIIEPMGTES